MFPISFSIPESLIVESVPEKSQKVAGIVPGCPYAFDDYFAYASEYQRSRFGLTWRKAGWDCLRHYEIIANGCIPLFIDFDRSPASRMTTLPRWLSPSSPEMIEAWADPLKCSKLTKKLLQHARELMTCRATAGYVLKEAGLTGAERILWVNEHSPDYLDVLTLIGMKQLLGKNCVEVNSHDWLYSDYSGDLMGMYGRGFVYTRQLNPDWRPDRWEKLSDFDVIIWGSWERNKQHWLDAVASCDHKKLVRIIGEDNTTYDDNIKVTTFARELP